MRKNILTQIAMLITLLACGCTTNPPSISGKWVTPTICAGTVLLLDENESIVDGLGYYWNDVSSPRYFRISGERGGNSILLTKKWINTAHEETVTYIIREEKGMGLSLVNIESEAGFPDFTIYIDSFVRPKALEKPHRL
jgi:hypothetical protein